MPAPQPPSSQSPPPPPTPLAPAPSTPCSPTQPCPVTPSQQSTSPASTGLASQPRRNIQASPTGSTREYGFDLNEQWQQDAEFYDNQKISGLTFPRAIRSSAFTTQLDIEGCDPLKLPVAALLYQQHNNHWLRKLAWGRELYLVPVGDLAGVVFATELLGQLRSRGIDIDRVCQHKTRQEGKTLDKKGNTKFAAQLVAEHMQNWLPSRGTDPESHHKITALQEEVAKLRQQLGTTSEPPSSAPASIQQLPHFSELLLVAPANLFHLASNPHRSCRCLAVRTLGLRTIGHLLWPRIPWKIGSRTWTFLRPNDPLSRPTWKRSLFGGTIKVKMPSNSYKRWR